MKCWVYRGDRLANGEAPGIVTPPGAEDDRRSRRPGGRPGGPGAPGGRGRPGGPGADRGPRPAAAADRPAVAADATTTGPAAGAATTDAPKVPAVKRVRKAAAPGAESAKGEGKGE